MSEREGPAWQLFAALADAVNLPFLLPWPLTLILLLAPTAIAILVRRTRILSVAAVLNAVLAAAVAGTSPLAAPLRVAAVLGLILAAMWCVHALFLHRRLSHLAARVDEVEGELQAVKASVERQMLAALKADSRKSPEGQPPPTPLQTDSQTGHVEEIAKLVPTSRHK